ncbi:MAG: cation:proton antiporter [Brevinematales bacterium]|nr:cation:proton antiporter [Brevinematales bacterium]
MKTRYQSLINVAALIFLAIAVYLITVALTDTSGGGKGLNSSELNKRVSYRYIIKSVNPSAKPEVKWGEAGFEESSANIVTSIVVNYRGFDTLGEVLVLFASSAAVSLLIRKRTAKKVTPPTQIMTSSVPVVNLLVFILGAFIILHGHLTPGGGFPGGAVIASGVILVSMVFRKAFRPSMYLMLESLAGMGILIVGLLGMVNSDYFLQDFFPTGNIGNLFSSYFATILYILIGIKVAVEISNIGFHFISESIGEESV